MKKPLLSYYPSTDEQLRVLIWELNLLIDPDEIPKEFIKHFRKHIKSFSAKNKHCLIDNKESAHYVYFILSGSVLVYGDRWAEVKMAKARAGIEIEKEVSKQVPQIKELKRNLERVKLVEFFTKYDFILATDLLNGEPSAVKIVLSENSEFLCMTKKNFEKLLRIYRHTEILANAWTDKRLTRLLQYETEQEGKTVVDNMIWLDEKWPNSLKILTDLQIGQILGYRREIINGYIKDALKEIEARKNPPLL